MLLTYGNRVQEKKAMGQASLFATEGDAGEGDRQHLDIEEYPNLEEADKLRLEAELMGIYVSGHPLNQYRELMEKLSSIAIANIPDVPPGRADNRGRCERDFVLSGLLVGIKPILTKKGDRMAFATLEDLTGKIECIIYIINDSG